MRLLVARIACPAALLLGLAACVTPRTYDEDLRERFRDVVEQYQSAVVPICTGKIVAEYNDANAARDQAFVASLRATPLMDDYRSTVAATGARISRRVYHCSGPPPPPGTVAIARDDASAQEEARRRHFASGDELFAKMVALRNQAMGTRGN